MSDPSIWPYQPKVPPEGEDVPRRLARWAYQQFQEISDATGLRPAPMAVLQGKPGPMTVDSTRRIVTGYPVEYEGEGFRNMADPATGIITAPQTGLYRVEVHFGGSHSSATQNDAAMCFLRAPGGDLDLAGWPVATNKVTYATFDGSITTGFQEGDTISAGLYATTSLGTFTFESGHFLLEFVSM